MANALNANMLETGKYLIQAGDETKYISGVDAHATVIIDGDILSGYIALEVYIKRDVEMDDTSQQQGQFGVKIDPGEPFITADIIHTADIYKEPGVYTIDLNAGLQYRLRASNDLTGEVSAYLGAGGLYDRHNA